MSIQPNNVRGGGNSKLLQNYVHIVVHGQDGHTWIGIGTPSEQQYHSIGGSLANATGSFHEIVGY
jgi:hypothetical protein